MSCVPLYTNKSQIINSPIRQFSSINNMFLFLSTEKKKYNVLILYEIIHAANPSSAVKRIVTKVYYIILLYTHHNRSTIEFNTSPSWLLKVQLTM